MKTIFPFFLSALTAAVIASPAQAQIKNPGFEFVTADWLQSGDLANFTAPTSIVGFYQSVNPVEATHFGLISNEGVASKTISTSFVVTGSPTSAKFLNFEYRFLTDELNQPLFDDKAQVVLTPESGAPVTLVEVSRNDLQAAGNGALRPGAAYLDTQTIGHAGWQTSTTDISAYIGKKVTLSFTVDNGGDAEFLVDSKLAIDNLRITEIADTLRPTLKINGKKSVGTRKASYVLRGTAKDKNGIVRVEVKVGKGEFQTAKIVGAATSVSWKFTAKLKPGLNAVQVRSIDGAGNVSTIATVSITRE